MNYRTIDQAQRLATILPARVMSCSLRLERWADRLDQHRTGKLRPLRGTEFGSNSRRSALREDDSPLSVAFADPFLRALGLAGDTYGAAHRFFDVSHGTLHEITCYCHYTAEAVSASAVAARVRRAAQRARRIERMIARVGLGGTRVGPLLTRLFA
jgi:hypothetical protein